MPSLHSQHIHIALRLLQALVRNTHCAFALLLHIFTNPVHQYRRFDIRHPNAKNTLILLSEPPPTPPPVSKLSCHTTHTYTYTHSLLYERNYRHISSKKGKCGAYITPCLILLRFTQSNTELDMSKRRF